MRNYSENTAAEIDNEINAIITAAYDRCKKILTDHMDKLNAVAKYLMSKEKMDGKVFSAIMNGEAIEEKEEDIGVQNSTNTESEVKDIPESDNNSSSSNNTQDK